MRSSTSSSSCADAPARPAAPSPVTARPSAQRRGEAVRQASRAPIPAPNADPPGELVYSDLQVSTFTTRCGYPLTWPQFAADLEAAVNGDATNLKIARRPQQTPEGFAEFDDLRRDLVRSTALPASRSPHWPHGDRPTSPTSAALGSDARMGALGSVRVGLAGARPRAIHGAVERHDRRPRSC